MRDRIKTTGFIVATVVASGCAETPTPMPGILTDSAAVAIVTNSTGSIERAPVWRFSPAPLVAVGEGSSPEAALRQVTALAPLADGRIAVGAESPALVRMFDREGALVGTIGRAGQGPGEFSTVTSVLSLGEDSLVIWDQNRRRASVFTLDGRLQRDIDLSALALLSPMASPSAFEPSAFTYLLPSSSGSWVLFAVGALWSGEGPHVQRLLVPSYRITVTGEPLESLGPYPGLETFGGSAPWPFAAGTYGGTLGEELVVGTADAPEFRRYAPDGSLRQIVRWPDEDRTVGGPFQVDWTEFLDTALSTLPPEDGAHLRAAFAGLPPAERFPAYDGILTTDTGEIWVGAYAGQYKSLFPPRNAPVPERRWLVFDSEGTLLATAATPRGFQPHTVHADIVWGVFQDDSGVESVRAYQLVR